MPSRRSINIAKKQDSSPTLIQDNPVIRDTPRDAIRDSVRDRDYADAPRDASRNSARDASRNSDNEVDNKRPSSSKPEVVNDVEVGTGGLDAGVSRRITENSDDHDINGNPFEFDVNAGVRIPLGVEILPGTDVSVNTNTGNVTVNTSTGGHEGLNASSSVTINPRTGEVVSSGGGVSVSYGRIGASVSRSVSADGCIETITVNFSFGPVYAGYSFTVNHCRDEEEPEPEPEPGPEPSPNGFDPNTNRNPANIGGCNFGDYNWTKITWTIEKAGYSWVYQPGFPMNRYAYFANKYTYEAEVLGWDFQLNSFEFAKDPTPNVRPGFYSSVQYLRVRGIRNLKQLYPENFIMYDAFFLHNGETNARQRPIGSISPFECVGLVVNNAVQSLSVGGVTSFGNFEYLTGFDLSPGSEEPPATPPHLNTLQPPRRENMDDCCRLSIQLLKKLVKHQGAAISSGESWPENVRPWGDLTEEEGATVFPLEIPSMWLDPKKDEDERMLVRNDRHLTLIVGAMLSRLERFVGVSEFLKSDDKQLKSDPQIGGLLGWLFGSLSDGQNFFYPSPDQVTRDEEPVSVKLEVKSLADAIRYLVEATNRLETLFPVAELNPEVSEKNGVIAESLIRPDKDGEIKVRNALHLQELLFQYLNNTLGNPRQEIILQDANPAVPGSQKTSFKTLSISDLMASHYKFDLDTAGDVDALMNLCLRSFRTALANRIQIAEIHAAVLAIVEDLGFSEKQEYKSLKLEGDPYAGHWTAGKGFEPSEALDANTEEATEKLLEETLKNFEHKVRVVKHNDRLDLRDLLTQLARLTSQVQGNIPATPEAIDDAINQAKFKVKTDMALIRSQVKKAGAASRSRTKKRRR